MATFPFITGPRQAHGARTPEEYLRIQRDYLARLTASGRAPAAEPFEATTRPVPYISAGRWMLLCTCHGGVSVSVEWDLACCLECGAIYRGLQFPAEREDIEAALVARPVRFTRNWRPPQTVADLLAENVAQGEV